MSGHGTGWAGVNRHRAHHDLTQRIANRQLKIDALEDEIRALQDANRTDRTTLEHLAHPTPVLTHTHRDGDE